MKVPMSFEDWKKFEEILMCLRLGYNVIFDDHNGIAEMVIDINTISVYRHDNEPVPKMDEDEVTI